MSKKALDVTTKDWSKKDIDDLKKIIYKKNFRWTAKALHKSGKIKWFHAYTKADVEILAIQEGYVLLKVTKN